MWHAWRKGKLHKGFSEETRGKDPLGRPRRRCEFYVKMDTKEIDIDLLSSGLVIVVGCFEYGNEPFDSMKFEKGGVGGKAVTGIHLNGDLSRIKHVFRKE
jgi:hypothetical protein